MYNLIHYNVELVIANSKFDGDIQYTITHPIPTGAIAIYINSHGDIVITFLSNSGPKLCLSYIPQDLLTSYCLLADIAVILSHTNDIRGRFAGSLSKHCITNCFNNPPWI